jgi:riboflavin kinase/FMN adenylyltransferase
VRCGSNWRFGRGGEGDAEWLRARGYRVTVVPSVSYRGEGVSSTRIRAALERGEVEDANAMLGRPFSAAGVPFSGKGEGTRIGCPTVNLRLDSTGIRLPRGAYAAEVCGVRAVANWGVAPTFGTRAWESPVLEVHFLSPVPALPSSRIHVSFLRFIRPERKFDGLDSLRAQIALDCESARA